MSLPSPPPRPAAFAELLSRQAKYLGLLCLAARDLHAPSVVLSGRRQAAGAVSQAESAPRSPGETRAEIWTRRRAHVPTAGRGCDHTGNICGRRCLLGLTLPSTCLVWFAGEDQKIQTWCAARDRVTLEAPRSLSLALSLSLQQNDVCAERLWWGDGGNLNPGRKVQRQAMQAEEAKLSHPLLEREGYTPGALLPSLRGKEPAQGRASIGQDPKPGRAKEDRDWLAGKEGVARLSQGVSSLSRPPQCSLGDVEGLTVLFSFSSEALTVKCKTTARNPPPASSSVVYYKCT